MLYALLKVVFKTALRVFFRSIKVNHKELIPRKGPMIVVANHPNTFMDPLLVAALIRPQVYFLANSSIFSTPFQRWLFKNLHMIPIQRKIDTNKNKFDNEKIFQQCYEFLGKGGTIIIFPEGTSIRERRLRKLKTGTARIALGAEAYHKFNLDLKVLCVGLNYSEPGHFRSDVYINVEDVISVKEYQEVYEKAPFETAKELTERIRAQLEKEIIITENEAEDALARQIEEVYKDKLGQELKLSEQAKEQDYLLSKGIVEAVHFFREQDPPRIKKFQEKIQTYLRNLDWLHLSDEVFSKQGKNKGLLGSSILTALYFLLGFPLFLYGLINNYIPYIIPSRVANYVIKLSKVEEYRAPIQMVTGIFSFAFFYFLQVFLVGWFFNSFWIGLAYFLSLPISGFFALFYANYLRDTKDKWRLLALFYKRQDLISNLLQQRKEIIQELELAKKEYLDFYSETNE